MLKNTQSGSPPSQETEKAPEVSEKIRDALYRSMQEGICFHEIVYDGAGEAVDYIITGVNPAYEAITGLRRQDAVGRKASDLYRTGKPPYLEIYAEVARTGKPTLFETYFAPMDKHFSISVFSPEKGEFVTVFSDITQRKKEQQELEQYRDHLKKLVETRTRELREINLSLEAEVANRKRAEDDAKAQRQLFIDVLDTLPCYLVLLTPDHHVPFANRFFRERFGESHGQRCFEYLFQRTTPCEVCDTYKVLDAMQPIHWEWAGPDGHNYDIYDFPFHDVDGSTLIMEAGIDITDQKKSQAALRAAHAELEKRVEERTTELRNKTEELERSNRDLETFAFAASHDLQEPLRMVTSFAQLLSQRYAGKLDEDADKYIRMMTDGAGRMNIMITDLLQFSRIQSRGAPFGAVDLNQSLRDALANLVITLKESSARVTSDPLPVITGDASQLTQVFQNLISNGIKYRKASESPVIHVGVARGEPGDMAQMYVRDNGIGIDPAHFDKLFIPFHRLHAWGKYPGTGIGLATCKKIVERHGGQIRVESEQGKGSTFYFSIPTSP